MSDPTTADDERQFDAQVTGPRMTTTAETPTMRDECITAIKGADEWSSFFGRDEAGRLLDAALNRMLEPSEGMLVAARDWSIAKYRIPVGDDCATGCMQAMIQSILNETKD